MRDPHRQYEQSCQKGIHLHDILRGVRTDLYEEADSDKHDHHKSDRVPRFSKPMHRCVVREVAISGFGLGMARQHERLSLGS